MSEENLSQNNPAEPVANVSTVAEAAQPEEPDELRRETQIHGNHVHFSDLLQRENGSLTRNEENRNELPLKLENTKKPKNEITEEIAKALNFYESKDNEIIPFAETLTNTEQITKKFYDKFTQTFFKYMKNLSNSRVMEIIKQNINHSDESLIFFCSEDNLRFTF
ncbi:uncharacterized protein LOC127286609 isoform X1 [Leptopilina boulardi]|uniref:uncharacterized protein LOC127286609 isoform X1 n=1 Tax=Leptopilina boulardi TaxID=63433 RepID=UPI0021F50B70|nr:uncharacterized protein LOC127286609 isoform X1 [Leptopilina boulardi]